TFGPYRQEQRRSLTQFLVVEIAAVLAWLNGGDRTIGGRRRHTHYPEERCEVEFRSPRQPAGFPVAVDRDMRQERLRKILRNGAGQRPEPAKTPVVAQFYFGDMDFQHVAGFSPGHSHRAGDDVPRRAVDI